MTPEEHDHVQALEGQVKRYRSRIVALKNEIERIKVDLGPASTEEQRMLEAFGSIAEPEVREAVLFIVEELAAVSDAMTDDKRAAVRVRLRQLLPWEQ